MRTGTKIGLLGLAASAIVSITFGVIEIKDRRNGKKRLNEEDMDMIADKVATKQEEIRLAKRRKPKVIEEN